MQSKIVYQTDSAGLFVGNTVADESPREPGVWHIPSGCVEKAPPAEWHTDQWPRWNGVGWELVTRPNVATPREVDARDKLRAFLADNPDVAAYISN